MIQTNENKEVLKDGIPICKGFIITEDYIAQNRKVIEQWINLFVAYPDILIDLITPSDSTFKLFFYQRIFFLWVLKTFLLQKEETEHILEVKIELIK